MSGIRLERLEKKNYETLMFIAKSVGFDDYWSLSVDTNDGFETLICQPENSTGLRCLIFADMPKGCGIPKLGFISTELVEKGKRLCCVWIGDMSDQSSYMIETGEGALIASKILSVWLSKIKTAIERRGKTKK